MRREALLAGVAVGTFVVTVGVAAVVPGFVSPPETGPPERPTVIDVADTTLAAGDVTAETAELNVTTFLRHAGADADNVTVVVRAVDSDSGLVVDTASRELGTVSDEGERAVPVSVTVPREGGYRVTTLVYVDGQRMDAARATVSGVGALTPPYARTSVSFHRFPQRPSVEYTVASVDDDSATLSVTTYLTNRGDDVESGLRLVLTARQADSNVVADRTAVSVGRIESGRTATVDATLTVPDGYNYYLDATLWRDGVILESTRAVANLDPRETLDANRTSREVQFRASDFETDPTGGGGGAPRATPSGGGGQPGFGVGVAIAALLAGLAASRRWSA